MRTTADYLHVFCNRAAWCVLPFGHDGDCDVKAQTTTITTTSGESPLWVSDNRGIREATPEELQDFAYAHSTAMLYPKIHAVSDDRHPRKNFLVRAFRWWFPAFGIPTRDHTWGVVTQHYLRAALLGAILAVLDLVIRGLFR